VFGQDRMGVGAGPGEAADARRAPRANVSWRARVLLSAEAFTEGRTLNASETGVSLLCDRRFADGAVLTVALGVPEPNDRSRLRPVTAQARVVFNVASGDLFRHGLVFTQIDPDARQLIRHWVQQLG